MGTMIIIQKVECKHLTFSVYFECIQYSAITNIYQLIFKAFLR